MNTPTTLTNTHETQDAENRSLPLLKLLKPYVRSCGNEPRYAWKMDARCLLDYLLVYIADGRGVFMVAGKTYPVSSGDLFWVPPGTPHTMEGFPPTMVCPYIHFDLVYRPGGSDWEFTIPGGTTDLSQLKQYQHPPVTAPPFDRLQGPIPGGNHRRIGNLINDICVEATRAQPFSRLIMSGLLSIILGELCRHLSYSVPPRNEHLPKLEQIERYMADHCDQPLRIHTLASRCRLSVSRFRQLFGHYFGRSPREYLRRLRVLRAIQLITYSDLNLTEIAWQCGFATVHSFSKSFKSVEGVSPRNYRRFGHRYPGSIPPK